MNNQEIANELEDSLEKMRELLYDVSTILNYAPPEIAERAKSYWLSQIQVALDEDHDWLAGCMCTMDNTINELRSFEGGEEKDD